jgi:glycosyltransferase involved in cell wall biosynthesis
MSKRMMPLVVAVSDVSVGYGSPQIPMLVRDVARRYGAEAVIVEPDQSGMALMRVIEGCRVERIRTAYNPHSTVGRIDYVLEAARRVNELQPDVLIVFCTYSLPVLLKLKRRPSVVIYSSIESVSAYAPAEFELNRSLAEWVDVVIYPEKNRAQLDMPRCGLQGKPVAIMLNATNPPRVVPVPLAGRNGAILYAGTLDPVRTNTHYFFGKPVGTLPIDVFGAFRGSADPEFRRKLEDAVAPGVRYQGLLPAAELAKLRARYAYSIVMWAPTNENQRFAAPNKFFEAIGDGVPPIVTPHPQCAEVIARYGCGLLIEDWSPDAFNRAIRRATDMYGSPAYTQMVENCARAAESDLNWDAQIGKLRGLLPPLRLAA